MAPLRFPTDLILYRGGPGESYRIGAVEGADHALATLNPAAGVRRVAEGHWVFVDEKGGEYETADGLPERSWDMILSKYPLPLGREIMQNNVRRHVFSDLTFRLILRGVRDPRYWALQLDDGLKLIDDEGEVRAVVATEDWWFVDSPTQAHILATEIVESTDLEPLTLEELQRRFNRGGGT